MTIISHTANICKHVFLENPQVHLIEQENLTIHMTTAGPVVVPPFFGWPSLLRAPLAEVPEAEALQQG